MNPELLSTLYYISAVTLVIFSLSLYLLKVLFDVDLWLAWKRPKVSMLVVVFGSIWWIANLGLSAYLSFLEPRNLFFVGIVWKSVAAFLLLTGMAVGLWATKLFKTVKRLYGGDRDMLVTEGPYRYTRHPQYLSLMLNAIALAIFFNTLQVFVFAITITASAYTAALMEEMELEKIFGQKYRDYKNKTPFFPFLRV